MLTKDLKDVIKNITIKKGRLLISGDIHGMFNILNNALKQLGFDENNDTFVTVGDLIDRGELSKEAAFFLNQKNRYSVLGNHEELMIDAVKNPGELTSSYWNDNGGFWENEGVDLNELADQFLNLPIAIEIDFFGKKIGIVHAGVPHFISSWDFFCKKVKDREKSVIDASLWSRVRYLNKKSDEVSGIDYVISGHSIVTEPIFIENSLFIDTGAFFCGKNYGGVELHPLNGLTILEFFIDEDGELVFDTYFFQS